MATETRPGLPKDLIPTELAPLVENHRLFNKHNTPEGLEKIKRGIIKTNFKMRINRCGSLTGFDPQKERHLHRQNSVLKELWIHGELLS